MPPSHAHLWQVHLGHNVIAPSSHLGCTAVPRQARAGGITQAHANRGWHAEHLGASLVIRLDPTSDEGQQHACLAFESARVISSHEQDDNELSYTMHCEANRPDG